MDIFNSTLLVYQRVSPDTRTSLETLFGDFIHHYLAAEFRGPPEPQFFWGGVKMGMYNQHPKGETRGNPKIFVPSGKLAYK